MCLYNVIPFTTYTVIVQNLRIDTFCMSEAVMRLITGTFYYENVVIGLHMTDARVDIDQRSHYNSFSWCNSMSA